MYGILEHLPGDCLVYYEPKVRNRCPDFVMMLPDLGLMVIEVKGWYRADVVAADNNTISVKGQTWVVRREHPLQQAMKYMFELMDVSRTHPQFQKLLQIGGEHENREHAIEEGHRPCKVCQP